MNPFPVVLADLRAMRGAAWLVVALIACAVAIGIAVGAQERGLRQASARAADDFDLIIGAPGSQTQLVLTAVYLQPEALPLIDGAVLNRLAADPRVAASAPLAFGDIVQGYPVIGTTAAFVTRWGRVAPSQGRLFAAEGEAVIGADVALRIGQEVTPAHDTQGAERTPGSTSAEESAHRHEGEKYTVVGRLPRGFSPWDRAILVPVESVWETHGLGNGHAADPAVLGPPYDAAIMPGVPAVVVKPLRVADAYALRAQYRQGGTMALFPAEVLVSLYRSVGDVRDVLLWAVALNNLLVFAAILLLVATLTSLRRRRYAVLRALGASRLYIVLVTWLGATLLILAGSVVGVALGWGGGAVVAMLIESRTGLAVAAAPGWSELRLAGGLALAGGLLAVLPALAAYRGAVADGLRD